MKLLDPDNGFGKTWSQTREVLAENFPEHQFQEPAKVPANITILSNQEFDDLRGDHPLPNNTDDWDSYPSSPSTRCYVVTYSDFTGHRTTINCCY